MTITTYAELKTAISDFLADGEDGSLVEFRDTFIDLAESYFNRTLRTADMEERTTLTTDSDGRATLPTGLLAIRSARYNGSPLRELRATSLGGGNRLSPYDTADVPVWYSITSISNAKILQLTPIQSSAEVFLTYFEKIPALNDNDQTTNWLLDLAPDAYLYRCLAEAYTWRQAFDKAAGFANYVKMICDDLTSLDERARYGNAEMTFDGIAP